MFSLTCPKRDLTIQWTKWNIGKRYCFIGAISINQMHSLQSFGAAEAVSWHGLCWSICSYLPSTPRAGICKLFKMLVITHILFTKETVGYLTFTNGVGRLMIVRLNVPPIDRHTHWCLAMHVNHQFVAGSRWGYPTRSHEVPLLFNINYNRFQVYLPYKGSN